LGWSYPKRFFQELSDKSYFNAVRIVLGSIEWPNGQDFCPDTLYEASLPITESATVEVTFA